MSRIDTNPDKINELLTRSVDTVYPSRGALEEKLKKGEQLRVYMGIDPTSSYVHLGHTTNYIILRRFHELGHKVVVLVGDFTAMIGDPSDKNAARIRLTKEEVQKNLKDFKEQIGKILDFSDAKNPVEFRLNSEWLASLTLEKAAELASNFTVQQMLERDVFEKRIAEKKPLYVHEFFYPLIQGYDSVALSADVEIGGTDQTFNMLAGRTLVERLLHKEKFVITTTLLVNPKTGEKLMSKSQGTGIGLNEDPTAMFGKIMALPDEGMIQCFIDCTYLPLAEIKALKQNMKKNPKEVKMRLAREIVAQYHSPLDAEQASDEFNKVFSQGDLPDTMPEITVPYKKTELQILVSDSGLVSSKSEARRLIEQGAVEINGTRRGDVSEIVDIENGLTLRIGKHRFVRVHPS